MSLGFQQTTTVACWIDNLYAVGDSPFKAISILNESETFLRSKWKLRIKPDSKLFMPVRGNRAECSVEGWSEVTSFPCLGHIIQASGSASDCIDSVIGACWRAFWKNVSKPAAGPLNLSL